MAGWLPLLLCIFFSVGLSTRQLALAGAASSSSSKIVTSLPGFPGRLPFHLETGYAFLHCLLCLVSFLRTKTYGSLRMVARRYVEVDEDNGAELFYYFVESEAGGENAPLLLWLTGGDHCSVLSGLALEIGPFQFVAEPYNGTVPSLEINPFSWTKVHSCVDNDLLQVANILFVDTPVGAGFSFSRKPEGYNVGEISTSLQLHELLIKWSIDHPKFLARPLYIGGDSYAGKIVPFIAQKISEGIEAGRSPILNLKGYLVGNPLTGETIDISYRVPYAHGFGIISDQLYETISGHCRGEDYNSPRNVLCAQALGTFNDLLSQVMTAQILLDRCAYASSRPTEKSGGSARKILSEEAGILKGKQLKNPTPRVPLGCISYTAYLSYYWANDELTREALGIHKGTVDEWVRCQSGNMPFTRDIKSSIKYHRNVTANGYRALVYSGDHDAIVPHLGTQAWVRSLGFPVVDDWRAWHLHGQSAGFTISYANNMTFTTIKGAGHTAPQYEPERCFAMFSRWIVDHPL
ncbi:serine carboxypeptidase-like 19 [Lolium rigidum]|uniref:serine carboxypeptidase-like 19 n=1 Tax=Lolium rigidum TaxID=89674 RepID=UPI001F5CF482|nr:serine carboxypeptidase-like 19 [Lolium rigidum]